MNGEMKWERINWMKRNVRTDLYLSMSFSLFGMLLIFGLGFVFPNINPYSAIKWIVIVTAVVFAYSLLSFIVMECLVIKAKIDMRKEGGKPAKARKTSKK